MHPADELKLALEGEDRGEFYPDNAVNWQAQTNPHWHPDQWAAPTDHLYDDVELQQ